MIDLDALPEKLKEIRRQIRAQWAQDRTIEIVRGLPQLVLAEA